MVRPIFRITPASTTPSETNSVDIHVIAAVTGGVVVTSRPKPSPGVENTHAEVLKTLADADARIRSRVETMQVQYLRLLETDDALPDFELAFAHLHDDSTNYEIISTRVFQACNDYLYQLRKFRAYYRKFMGRK